MFKKKENKKEKPKYVRICPKCHSLDVEVLNVQKQFTFAFGLPPLYKCKKCGFSNYVFPEIDLNEYEKENKK